MKYLILIGLVLTSACQAAPYGVATGIGALTGVALTTNEPKVEEFGDKYLTNKE